MKEIHMKFNCNFQGSGEVGGGGGVSYTVGMIFLGTTYCTKKVNYNHLC